MYWDDLNADNIERAKELYIEYIEQNKHSKYTSQLESFEEYLQNNVTRCSRCSDWFDMGTMKKNAYNEWVCQCCYDDLYGVHDNWIDNYEEEKLKDEGLL